MLAVNSMRAHGLKHKQFQSFLEDIEADFTDVLYHTNVCWHGKSTKEGVGPQSRDCHVFQYERHLVTFQRKWRVKNGFVILHLLWT